MNRIKIFVLFLCFNIGYVFAIGLDSTSFSFKKSVIEFEIIYEADGSIPITFEYTNIGQHSLKINRIIAPGLGVIKFSKDSILPGEKGLIQTSINPFNKKGYFNKKVIVFSNATNSPNELSIKGMVVGGSVKSSFKHIVGNAAFRQLQLNFGYIYSGSVVTRYIPVLNTSNESLELSFSEVPSHLKVSTKFEILASGNMGLIEIVYNTIDINDWDFIIDKITVISKENKNTSGQLMVTANIREDFSLLTEEDKLSQPKASLPIKVFNYDTIPSGEIIKVEFPIYNKGNSDLNIRSVKPTCGCTAVLPKKNIISPGDSTIIIVEFNSSGFLGNDKKGVTIITNDPLSYKNFLWITGYIE